MFYLEQMDESPYSAAKQILDTVQKRLTEIKTEIDKLKPERSSTRQEIDLQTQSLEEPQQQQQQPQQYDSGAEDEGWKYDDDILYSFGKSPNKLTYENLLKSIRMSMKLPNRTRNNDQWTKISYEIKNASSPKEVQNIIDQNNITFDGVSLKGGEKNASRKRRNTYRKRKKYRFFF